MEELDLKELFVMFWNKKAQIILVVLIFIAIGVIYTVGFTTPKYSASTSLLLAGSGSSGTQTNTITTTDVTLNSKLVSTYSELVKSKNVLGQVISNLNINEISSEVGFTYPRYFSSTFKQMKGMTPKQFREENRMK